VRPKNKGFGNPFQTSPTPCKKCTKPTPKQWGHNPRVELCPKTTKKNEEKLKILEKWGFGFFVGKMGKIVEMGGGGGW
jgi:hypothetical protein